MTEFVNLDALADLLAERVAAKLATPEPREPVAPTSKLAVSIAEAADLLGVSPDSFRRHVLPDLKVVRAGRLRLIPVAELEQWLDRHAARTLARGSDP